MFTGIIQELGKLERIENKQNGVRLWIQAPKMRAISQMGDSIATNGVCLTYRIFPTRFLCGRDAETMRRTAFASLKPGAALNLEPALRLADRLAAICLGHVDAVGRVLTLRPEGNAVLMESPSMNQQVRC